MTFVMTEPLDPDNLPASNVEPRVSGRKTVYTTETPEKGVRLDFAPVRWSVRNILRRKTWYDVDAVEVDVVDGPNATEARQQE